MNIFFPVIPRKRLPGMFRIAALGAISAGVYGALHDQLSYTISPEYFMKMKFLQFSWANFGWPQRVFASEVGFLASWWVGGIGGWILARFGLDQLPNPPRRVVIAKAFSIVFGLAILIGGAGLLLGTYVAHHSDLKSWHRWRDVLEVLDLQSFVIVAYLHGASYLGALVGVIGAVIYVRKTIARSQCQVAEHDVPHPVE